MKTVGIIGGGQLGRMLAMAAARLSIRTIILEPQEGCPAAQVANDHIIAAYDDAEALRELAEKADIITYEFENVPEESAARLAAKRPVFPPPRALSVSQDRLTEKTFLNDNGIPTAGFRAVDTVEALEAALADFGGRGVLKTRRFGYDGKGQWVFAGEGNNAEAAFEALNGAPAILEEWIAFEREISVIAARGPDGGFVCFDPAENVHRDGILRTSTVPGNISPALADEAKSAASKLMNGLGYVGVCGVEFFVGKDGALLANEFAPRVHNSGHWSEGACVISQFEQHIRAICGLPLIDPVRHSDCVMHNLIGDDMDRISEWMTHPGALVHLYGKAETRPGRKMGHVTVLGDRQSS
ncbi:5-(carboxyamino)imidazole ribonucleotide synthase [Martelella mediterranea]|uniref:N5-carboxyaminoimidazole ribonucleotide synthase n=1 Tax=Martelella mediterranea TaxID=293089 RepID=A0A4V2V4J3_9HYPH|nr:5-(carboxyamino)imidazole ribonucleotide synthase [Martelella mediterranea]TCT40240.1 5-(carboxyamino)imidazole ribonucleotide synthase [Martelella mediterranea]